MSHSPTGLKFAGLTDVGLQRTTNQDSYYVSPKGCLFIVADGMGGHMGGQEASRLATEAIRAHLEANMVGECTSPELLRAAIIKANDAVLSDQRQHPERSDMGTTVVVVMRRDEQFWCVHVGDSRLYRLRENDLLQLTQDHTWVAQAMQAGDLTLDQLQMHPWRHVLSQCIGREDMLEIEPQRLMIQPGDRLLLCSDGLTEELSTDAIRAHLRVASTCEGAVNALVEAAKVQGGRDNITAIALSV